MSLHHDIPQGVYSFLDVTKDQLLLDLPERFWICSLGIVIMALIYFVEVQMPPYLGLPPGTPRLAGTWLMGVWVMRTQ